MVKRRGVLIDRDGVINQSLVIEGKPYAPRKISEFSILDGVAHAIDELKARSFVICIVTNQPDIGNGVVSIALIEEMHAIVRQNLNVDKIYYCPHKQTDGCDCRKPKSGMLRMAERDFNLDLAESWMIGDRASDIVAGQDVGSRTVFIDRHYREPPPSKATAVVLSLPEAAKFVLDHC